MFCSFGVLASRDGARVQQLNLCYDFVDKLITNQAYLISHSFGKFSINRFLQGSSPFEGVQKVCLVRMKEDKYY